MRQDDTRPRTVKDAAVGASTENLQVTSTFNDKSITFSSSLDGYDFDSILRQKQRNIVRLYELSDYYTDVDPIFGGIIKKVYTPFSLADDYRLVGANEKVKQKYYDYYRCIHLRDKMASIFLQYFKYGNVFVYLMEDGNILTLPVHLVRVANVMVDGEPVLELNCRSIRDDLMPQGIKAKKDWLDDEELKIRLKGFPKEVAKAVQEGKEYVQLNPLNTFALQDLKEDWNRYAVPMVASCLKAFQKKELISNYEDALIRLGARSFVHVKYGDDKEEVVPTVASLNQVANIFHSAMTGSALAVTNNWCKAEVIQPKTDDIFEYDKYKGCNADILSAGGISGMIVSVRSEDGSAFASAQVSMQTAAIRIKQAKDNFCEMMDKINARLNVDGKALTHSAGDQVPKFTFPPVDLTGNKAFMDTCVKLWKEGVLSNETLLQTHGYDMAQEAERRKKEKSGGLDEVLSARGKGKDTVISDDKKDKVGRPAMDDTKRGSDPLKAMTGKQPKPSNPEGSMT